MQYCLLMHYQEGPEIGLTEEDMAAGRAAFARYADDLDAAGLLIGTHVLQSAVIGGSGFPGRHRRGDRRTEGRFGDV